MTPKRILYVTSAGYGDGSTSIHRMKAMADLGHDVVLWNITTKFSMRMDRFLIARALRRLFGIKFDWSRTYASLRRKLQTERFDAMWLDKGIDLKPRLFEDFRRHQPQGLLIGYSPDDMMNPGNRSQLFLDTLPLYDVFFTTKSYNVKELEELGCKSAHFIGNAYHEAIHHPMELTAAERAALGGDIVFIGTWEEERANSLLHLAEQGLPVRIWGDPAWHQKIKRPPPSFQCEVHQWYGVDYSKVLNATKIAPCFLRKVNRDLQTTRSVEIPACGTFMLAERTEEHLELFEEGKEAEFFSSNEELADKAAYYLKHDDAREAIARAGRERCVRSGYSNHHRIKAMMELAFP